MIQQMSLQWPGNLSTFVVFRTRLAPCRIQNQVQLINDINDDEFDENERNFYVRKDHKNLSWSINVNIHNIPLSKFISSIKISIFILTTCKNEKHGY